MTCITIKEIIKDVASRRGSLPSKSVISNAVSKTFDLICTDSWDALNRYIDSRMVEMKSLQIPNFLTVW